MSIEDGIGIKTELNEGKKKDLFAELPSVGEAILKFDDPELKTVSWSIYSSDYAHSKSEDEKKEIAKKFDTEPWEVYKVVIRSLLNSDEFHKKVLEESGQLTSTQLRELVHGLDFVRDEIFEDVFHRVDMLLRHSVDIDLMCLMFKDLLRGQITGSTQQLFGESEIEMLSKVFSEDGKCQSDFVLAIMNTRGVECGNGLREDDTKFAEDFIKRLTSLSATEDLITAKKLEGLFFNRDTEELGQVFSGEFRNTLVKDSLAMVGLFAPKITEVNNSLTTGRKDYLLERARKLEIVKLLIKVEQLQNELLDFNLEDVKMYGVKSGTAESSTAATINKAIEYKVLDDLSDLSKPDWSVARHEVMEMFGEWQLDRGLRKIKRVTLPRWVSAWNTLVHERGHMKFVRIFVHDEGDIISIQSAKRLSEVAYDHDPVIELLSGKLVEKPTVTVADETKIYHCLSEGYSVLLENLSNKFLMSGAKVFGESDPEFIQSMMELRSSRFFLDVYRNDHYWLGYQIISSLFLHGYRENTTPIDNLDVDLSNRKRSGLSFVESFLEKLSLSKIGNRESRRLFETTRFEDDVEAVVVRRKVWVEDGDRMKLDWKMDKKNTLLDYMTSTDPEKRKKGQDKFLELFGV